MSIDWKLDAHGIPGLIKIKTFEKIKNKNTMKIQNCVTSLQTRMVKKVGIRFYVKFLTNSLFTLFCV